MIGTFLFDMDGLLVDSEPFWKRAEKQVFGALGLDLNDEMLRQVMGFRLSEVVEHWYQFQPWPNANLVRTENDILDCMNDFMKNEAEAMPGVYESLAYLKSKNYSIALASSSSSRLIDTIVNKLQIRDYFDLLQSAEFEPYGKPHPSVFLTTANKLGAQAKYCMVIEDSINGVIAAKAAKMICVAIPEPEKMDDPKFAIADYKIKSLIAFPDLLKNLEI